MKTATAQAVHLTGTLANKLQILHDDLTVLERLAPREKFDAMARIAVQMQLDPEGFTVSADQVGDFVGFIIDTYLASIDRAVSDELIPF